MQNMSVGKILSVFAIGLGLVTLSAHGMNESGIASAASGAEGTCAPTTIKTNQSDACLLQDKMVVVSSDANLFPGEDVIRTNFDNFDSSSGLAITGAIIDDEYKGQPASYWFSQQTVASNFLVADSVVQIRLPQDTDAVAFNAADTGDDAASAMKLLLLAADGSLIASLDEKSIGFGGENRRFVGVQSGTPFRSILIERESPWLIGDFMYAPINQ
jgi:hypothetical protein